MNHKFLFEATGGEDLGARLRGKSDSPNDVTVLEGMQAFASVRIPDFAVHCVSRILQRQHMLRTLRSPQMQSLPRWRH